MPISRGLKGCFYAAYDEIPGAPEHERHPAGALGIL